jgi:hypothetical protein
MPDLQWQGVRGVILALTVVAGSKKLVKMTNEMLRQLSNCMVFDVDPMRVVVFHNGCDGDVDKDLVDFRYWSDKGNIGFGQAVNLLIERELFDAPKAGGQGDDVKFTHVLVLNNDLEFPDKEWLRELLSEREGNLVLSPCTDNTATREAISNGRRNVDPIRVSQCSAFCWLVPVPVIHALRRKMGFNLFDPDFFAYGEDDYTGAVLRRYLDKRPFKVVPRSWVRHLKAKTGAEMKLHGGMKENLEMLRRKMRARGLK